MRVKYVPKACEEGSEPKFTGHIMLRKPTFDERMEMAELISDMEVGDDKPSKNNMKALRVMVAQSKKFYEVSDWFITRLSDGHVMSSFDELSIESDCTDILVEVAGFIMNGLKAKNA